MSVVYPNHLLSEPRGCLRLLLRLKRVETLVRHFYECPGGTYIIILARSKYITIISTSSKQPNRGAIIALVTEAFICWLLLEQSQF
jgi:hypothetical protein